MASVEVVAGMWWESNCSLAIGKLAKMHGITEPKLSAFLDKQIEDKKRSLPKLVIEKIVITDRHFDDAYFNKYPERKDPLIYFIGPVSI